MTCIGVSIYLFFILVIRNVPIQTLADGYYTPGKIVGKCLIVPRFHGLADHHLHISLLHMKTIVGIQLVSSRYDPMKEFSQIFLLLNLV